MKAEYKELSAELNSAWIKGSSENLKSEGLKCKDINLEDTFFDKDFLNCNQVYFKCLVESHPRLKIDNKIYKYKAFSLDRRFNPIVSFIRGENILKVKLLDSCKSTLLPKKHYSAGKKGENFLWDNKLERSYIDKNYRTNLDISLYLGRTERPIYAPSTNLSKLEKIQYCQALGGHLLQSRYFDAASFYPEKKENYFYKFPYPWTKERRQNKEKIKSRDCSNMYTKDCESIRPYKYGESIGVTWIGINNALGNYPEVFDNKFVPINDISLSSFYYKWNDSIHQVGRRDNSSKNTNIKGAFRCMFIY